MLLTLCLWSESAIDIQMCISSCYLATSTQLYKLVLAFNAHFLMTQSSY